MKLAFLTLSTASCLSYGLQISPQSTKKASIHSSSSSSSNGQAPALNRRDALLGLMTTTSSLILAKDWVQPPPSYAEENMWDDLPPEAQRSYLQYRIPLQTSADFYVFDLQELLQDPNEWGQVGELFQVNNNRGQGIPNRIEREFTNTMRILGLSMPPDTADEMRDAQFAFEKAMAQVSKATAGIRRDLPVELDKNAVEKAVQGWDEGRIAFNSFLTSLNSATGKNEMKTIPAPGSKQFAEYGRSSRRYLELKKKIKLCQNRGGPALSQAWGQLMVSGYLQDSCGIPDMEKYFYQ